MLQATTLMGQVLPFVAATAAVLVICCGCSPKSVRHEKIADTPPVVFNHLYVVLNEPQFAVFRDHPYFRERFAAVDAGFPKFAAVTPASQALYFRGRDTYLEIFGPNNRFGEPVGKVGLGWSVEQPGAIDWVENQLRGHAADRIERTLRRWDFETAQPVNWYHAVYRQFPQSSRTVWWFSEYHHEFFPALFPARRANHVDLARRTFLLDRFRPDLDLINLTGAELALSAEQAGHLTADLISLGYRQQTCGDECLDLIGTEFTLSLHTGSETSGLQCVRFDARRAPAGLPAHPKEGAVIVEVQREGAGRIHLARPSDRKR